MGDIWRTFRVSVAAILVSAGLLTSWLALPQSVAACSCATTSLVEFATFPGVAVFIGTVGVADADGLPVVVDTWFHGPDAAPIVHLDPAHLGNQGSSCGTPVPPPGARYIFAGGRAVAGGLIGLNLCTPHGDVSSPGGRALVAEAEQAFPGAQVLPRPAPTAPTVPTDPVSTIAGVAPFVALGMSALLVLGVVALLAAVGRRLRGSD